MTTIAWKQALPDRPHPDHLRKQAKARLATLRLSRPDACLAEAQHAVAQDYGFASWAKLQAEVLRRAATARERRVTRPPRRRRSVATPAYHERQLHDVLVDQAAQFEAQSGFFRAGAATSLGVLLVAVVALMSAGALLVSIL